MGQKQRRKCPVMGKTQWFSFESAEKQRRRLVNAERSYRCSACGYWHVTSMTEAEFAQAEASRGVQDSATRGMLDLTTEEYLAVLDRRQADEAAWEDQRRAAEARRQGRQPGEGAGGPGAEALERGTAARPAPSPAAVAARIAAGRHQGR